MSGWKRMVEIPIEFVYGGNYTTIDKYVLLGTPRYHQSGYQVPDITYYTNSIYTIITY